MNSHAHEDADELKRIYGENQYQVLLILGHIGLLDDFQRLQKI